MIAAYRFLLRLYPLPRRNDFADEMLAVFKEAEADVRREGIAERMQFYLRETMGLAGGALRERMRSIVPWRKERLTTGGPMILESGCRFPRSATAVMTLVLVIVVGMIVKIQGVSHLSGTIRGKLPAQLWLWPSHYGLISGILVVYIVAWIVGAAAWAAAYAMRRTAAQHLGNFETWPPAQT